MTSPCSTHFGLFPLGSGFVSTHERTPMGFHDITMESITGESVDFSQFAGQHTLVVNVASR